MTFQQGFRVRLLSLVLVTLVAAAALAGLLRIARAVDTGEKLSFQAVLPSAVTLVPRSDVRRAGVTVGEVTDVRTRGTTAVVGVRIDADRGPVYRDASVQVRAKTLLGEAYLDLDPGMPSAGRLPDGGDLPLPRARPAVQLDEILDQLDAARRARVQRLFGGLEGGVGRDRGRDLGETLASGSEALDKAAPLAGALAAERRELARLVTSFATVFSSLGTQREDIRRAARTTATAARAFGDRAAAVRATLHELGPTLTAARDATRRTARLGRAAPPVLDDAADALRALGPALTAAPRAARRGIPALRQLGASAPALRRLLRDTRRLGQPAPPALGSIGEMLRSLRPMLGFLSRYRDDIGGFVAGFSRAPSRLYDNVSQAAAIAPYVSDTFISTLSKQDRAVVEALIDAGGLGIGKFAGLNPYPDPGVVTRTNVAGKPVYRDVPRDPPLGQPVP